MNDRSTITTAWWRSPLGVISLCFLALGGILLVWEHTAHVFGALPYVFLLACPLMHLFMHSGHGGHHGHGSAPDSDAHKPPPEGKP
jgi:Protein of unknown function (DUF2933)